MFTQSIIWEESYLENFTMRSINIFQLNISYFCSFIQIYASWFSIFFIRYKEDSTKNSSENILARFSYSKTHLLSSETYFSKNVRFHMRSVFSYEKCVFGLVCTKCHVRGKTSKGVDLQDKSVFICMWNTLHKDFYM